ncbi:DNA polymerase III, beta subunit [Hymenobacter gelipurpurascens]|uniref:Beta sliding clamp n=1 Tax=Hymenobacter gelipurpurascens TaxID=89968 RepID=A0A212T8Q4_9BACT|nr:DNA polymerase III subunit beta [Hymenobacter gelipurpurascens]SNC62399.1 DNA polymerase III, beta subunit [Hymenobacter gelipurpurascens]
MSTTTVGTALTTFLLSNAALLKAAQYAQLAVPSHQPIVPILENLLLDITSESGQYGKFSYLRVTGYDLEHRFTSRPLLLERRDTDAAALCVPGKQLIELLKNLEDQPLTLKMLDYDKPDPSLHINAALTHTLLQSGTGSARYEIAGEKAGDYPAEVALGFVGTTLSVPGHILLAGLSATLPVTSTDELRPAMCGVLVIVTSNKLEFAATDGHRLVVMRKQDQHELKGTINSFILPRKACEILLKLVSQREVVEVIVGATQALFKLEKGEFQVRLIAEQYPDFHNVIPAVNPNVLIVHRTELLASVKRLLLFSNKTTYQVKFDLQEASDCRIIAEDLDFQNKATETIPGTYTGQDLDIGFNARFLRYFLEKMPCQSVKIGMSLPSRAAVLQSADADDGMLCLLMPVMLNNYL